MNTYPKHQSVQRTANTWTLSVTNLCRLALEEKWGKNENKILNFQIEKSIQVSLAICEGYFPKKNQTSNSILYTN
jgi:hypothetical protein